MTKKILITGATGAIGRELIKQLRGDGRFELSALVRDSRKNRRFIREHPEIKFVYGDITDINQVKAACTGMDVVLHMAAVIPPYSEDHPDMGRNINVGGTENVVKAMEEVCPQGFLLFTSSVAVYGDRISNHEISVGDTVAFDQDDQYGTGKIASEKVIQLSQLKWSILRLSAIFGVGNHSVSGIMFDVPLETKMEFTTLRDTARALHHSLDHLPQLENKIYNLGGGEACRTSYREFLQNAFSAFGLGKVKFHPDAFAKQGFHMGYYMDGDRLEEILNFRQDSISSYFDRFRKNVPAIQRWLTLPFGWLVRYFLQFLSKPLKAKRKGIKSDLKKYFGVE